MFVIERFMDSEKSINKRAFTTRDIFGIFVVLIAGLIALGSWQVFFDAVLIPDVANTVTALFWFSLLGAAFLLGTVVWKERFSQVIAPIVVFAPSFLFVQTWYHLTFVIMAGMFAYLAIRFVQDEIRDRVHFRFFHARAGQFTFLLGLSLALSSAYFASIKGETWEELVPRFSVGEGTAAIAIKTVAYVYPEWKNLANEGMTVDGFLLSLQKDKEGEVVVPEGMASLNPADFPGLAEYLKQNVLEGGAMTKEELTEELYLRTGREQIAKLTGKTVQGNEKIADVFSSAIQHRIITVLSGEQVSHHLSPAIVPLVLALLLFLTLLSLGAIAAYFWLGISFLVFQIALFFGWVKLERVMREQEILAP